MTTAQTLSDTDYKAIGAFIARAVSESIAPLIKRIDDLEARKPEKGEPGRDGKDGIDGKAGPAGSAGAPGIDGMNGKDGADGRNGIDGKDGPQGKEGQQGIAGRDGRDGAPGKDGANGKDGLNGKDGEPGRDGRDGFSLQDFDARLEEDGRVLILSFGTSELKKETRLQTGVSIYRGVYRDSETYERGDWVTWGGSGWHCNAETKERPGDGSKNWTLAIKKGRDGKDGDRGPEGPQGKQGLPGLDRR